jgi:glycosyltransferase involved in cell wall biosynthesis
MSGAGDSRIRVLWLGPVQSEERMLRGTAASPAALKWSTGFLDGLAANGAVIRHVGHEPARVWPYGPLRVRPPAPTGAAAPVGVPFVNLPGIRFRSMAAGYAAAVRRAVAEFGPDLLVSYNAERYVGPAARAAAAARVPWIPIVMDGDDLGLDRSWRWVEEAVRGAAGVAFLSHWARTHCPFPETFHMDGGITFRDLPDRGDASAPSVLYTGTKGPWGGLDLLLDAWERVRHPTARLDICGPGRHDRLAALVARGPQGGPAGRVTDHGVVGEARLRGLTERAAVLVNPRPPSFPGNRLNFPSKLLEYLGTGKPIVTTRTVSLAPEYDDVLVFAAGDSAAGLAAGIDRVLGWGADARADYRRRVAAFASRHGDWQVVTGRFLDWAQGLGCDPRPHPA